MSHNILLTGGSGYLGGTLLARWNEAQLPSYGKLFALVRSSEQVSAVKQYNATPLTTDASDPESIKETIINEKITIVLHIHDVMDTTFSTHSIAGLGEVKKLTGLQTHFLFTTGAKVFSEFVGMPTEQPLPDTHPDLYALQKHAIDHTPLKIFGPALKANCNVIEVAEAHGVRSYIFAPCIVYGKGEGFGNKTSIQTVAIIKAAKKLRQVYRVDEGRLTWPVCHVLDNTSLYLDLIRSMLQERSIGYGKSGYYIASSGSIAWDDIYDAYSLELKRRGVVDDETVKDADDSTQEKMAEILDGIPAKIQLGGLCTLAADNGPKIGWTPRYRAEHILEAARDEVNFILQNMKD
ncbi:NAD(P)-binding protein [Alternaria alternata]|nr:NAD(P)-binding protein [Alternaria alternata]